MLLALRLPCLRCCTKLRRPRIAARNPGEGEIIGTLAAGVKKGFQERHQLEGGGVWRSLDPLAGQSIMQSWNLSLFWEVIAP